MEIRFVGADGEIHPVRVDPGVSAMQAALLNAVPGIDGDCGGNAACGTCHVFVDRAWAELIDAPRTEHEAAMLEVIEDVRDNSRLPCQIILDKRMDGLVVHLPVAQF